MKLPWFFQMHPFLIKYMFSHIVTNHYLSIPHLWFVASPCHVQMFINLVVLTHITQNNNSNFINQKVHRKIKTTKNKIKQNIKQIKT